jgi:hypothetical protein
VTSLSRTYLEDRDLSPGMDSSALLEPIDPCESGSCDKYNHRDDCEKSLILIKIVRRKSRRGGSNSAHKERIKSTSISEQRICVYFA